MIPGGGDARGNDEEWEEEDDDGEDGDRRYPRPTNDALDGLLLAEPREVEDALLVEDHGKAGDGGERKAPALARGQARSKQQQQPAATKRVLVLVLLRMMQPIVPVEEKGGAASGHGRNRPPWRQAAG
jgi:hypothetical protein